MPTPPDQALVVLWLQFLTPIVISMGILLNWVNTRKVATKRQVQEVHILLNSERGIMLGANALNLEALAEITKTPKAIEAARLARQMSDAHIEKQSLLDAGMMVG